MFASFSQMAFQASERLHEKMTNFVTKNKAAQIHQGSRLALLCLLAFKGMLDCIV